MAGDLDEAARAWLGGRQRRARDRLAVVAVVALATLAAALLLLRGLADRRPEPAAAATVPGLARRGQGLADRQLQLLDELVRDEADPRRRQDLLGVDHLATRLRRTTETLLAMAGPDPAGRWARPVPWTGCCAPPWPRPKASSRPGGEPHPARDAGSTC